MKRPLAIRFAVVCVFALLFSLPFASAQQAGYDLMKTGDNASIELPTRAGAPAFSPSTIPLQGVPICACTGASDTIMHRGDRHPDGTADLTVVALFLKNSGTVHYGSKPVDVYITVNNSNGVIGQNTVPQPDGLTASTGTLNIHTDNTFDSDFTVYADVLVVAAGADVRNPANVLVHHAAPSVHLGAHGSPWSAIPPPGYPECFFPGNGFYPGGPVPEADPTTPSHRHPVTASSPVTFALTASPASGTVSCPVTVHFTGTITAPPGVSGTYKFLRSDGGIDTAHRTFGPGTTSVSTTWGPFSGAGVTTDGWQAIQITTTTGATLQSSHANFSIRCAP